MYIHLILTGFSEAGLIIFILCMKKIDEESKRYDQGQGAKL